MNVYFLYYFIYWHCFDLRSREQCLSNIYDENMFVSKTSLIRKLMLNHINGFIHRYVDCHKHLQIIDNNDCNILSWNGKSNDQMTTTDKMFLTTICYKRPSISRSVTFSINDSIMYVPFVLWWNVYMLTPAQVHISISLWFPYVILNLKVLRLNNICKAYYFQDKLQLFWGCFQI
jgi:hypothetical protein